MAVPFTTVYNTSYKPGATSLPLVANNAVPAGAKIIIAVTADNTGTNLPTATLTNIGGATPVQLISPQSANAGATAGSGVRFFAWEVDTVSAITGSTTFTTLAFSAAPGAVSIVAVAYLGLASAPHQIVWNTSSSGAPSLNSGATPPDTDDIIVVGIGGEDNAVPTGDLGVELNAGWQGIIGNFTTGGGAAANTNVGMEALFANSGGSLTYNGSTSGDSAGFLAIYHSLPNTWMLRDDGVIGTRNKIVYASGNDFFYVPTTGGAVYKSQDARIWTLHSTPSASSLVSMATDGTRVLTGNNAGTIHVSDNDGAFTSYSLSTNAISMLGYGNGLWIAGSSVGEIWTSTTGSSGSWTSRTNPTTSNAWNGHLYAPGPGLHIMGGNVGQIITSPDGTTWTNRAAGSNFSTQAIYGFATDGTTIVGVGGSSKIGVSTNGTSWTDIPVSTTGLFSSIAYRGIAYMGGTWRLAGASGTVAKTTTPNGAWTQENVGMGGGTILGIATKANTWVVTGNTYSSYHETGTPISASDTLSASVTDTNAGLVQTTTFAAKTASDTLSVAVTDTASVVITSLTKTANDTLSASVTENITSRGFGAADTLSASVTDTGTFATVAVVGADTLSASVTDSGSLSGNDVTTPVTGSDTLSAAVTDTSSITILNLVTASDTLSASVTETAQFATVNVVASDTLSSSVTDAAVTFVNRPGADGLNVVVTDSGSILVSGNLDKTASDTLTVAVTDAGTVAVTGTAFKTASDTLSAAVTDASTLGFVAVASDTLSVSVDELPDVTISEPPPPVDTALAQYTFSSNTEGFTAVLAANGSSTWDQSNGNPAPSLKITRSGKNNIASQSYWELVTTWQALGVDIGGVVTEVHLDSAWNRVSTFTNGTGVSVGPYDLRNAAGILIGTLWGGRAASAVDGGTAIGTQTGFTPQGADALHNATVRIRLYNTIGTTGTANPVVSINDDEITFTITFTPPIILDEHFDDATVSVTETSSVVVTQQLISAADNLNAGVTDAAASINIVGLTKTASDALTVSLTDTSSRQTLFMALTASDTLSTAITEIQMIAISVATVTDTLSVALTETSKVRVAGTFPMYDSDVVYNDIAEYNGGGQIPKVASDTLTTSLTESIAFATIPIPVTDTLSTNVTDSAAIRASRGTTDTLTASVDDTTATSAGSTAVDALAASVTETRDFSTTSVTTTDTLSASVTENRSFGTIQVSAADTLVAVITLEGTGGTRYFSSADVLMAAETEFTQRLVNGNIIITSQDAMFAAVTESYVFANIPRVASDTLSVSVADERNLVASRTITDTLTATVSDIGKAGVQRVASDTLSVSLTETTSKTFTSKYPSIVFDESGNEILTIPLLWTGTGWIELEMYLWNGVDWV